MPRPWKYQGYARSCEDLPVKPARDSQLFITLRLPRCGNGPIVLTEYRGDKIRYASLYQGQITFHDAVHWLGELKDRLRRTGGPPVLLIHGYNNSNEFALARAARLAAALECKREIAAPGCRREVVALTWPSYGKKTGYFWDEANAEWSLTPASDAVDEFASWVPEMDLVAHSMGNRLAIAALGRLKANHRLPRVRNFVMAAPDVDRDDLVRRLWAPEGLGVPVTMYVSLRDQALSASWRGHAYPRAGDFSWWVSGRKPYFAFASVPKLQVVDTTDVDRTILGHSYFIDSPKALADLCRVLFGKGPERPGIEVILPDAPNYVRVSKAGVADECAQPKGS